MPRPKKRARTHKPQSATPFAPSPQFEEYPSADAAASASVVGAAGGTDNDSDELFAIVAAGASLSLPIADGDGDLSPVVRHIQFQLDRRDAETLRRVFVAHATESPIQMANGRFVNSVTNIVQHIVSETCRQLEESLTPTHT